MISFEKRKSGSRISDTDAEIFSADVEDRRATQNSTVVECECIRRS